jgi:hypothetical protein
MYLIISAVLIFWYPFTLYLTLNIFVLWFIHLKSKIKPTSIEELQHQIMIFKPIYYTSLKDIMLSSKTYDLEFSSELASSIYQSSTKDFLINTLQLFMSIFTFIGGSLLLVLVREVGTFYIITPFIVFIWIVCSIFILRAFIVHSYPIFWGIKRKPKK